jgi:hypothetical protein
MIGSPKVIMFDTPQPTLSDVWKLEEGLSRVEKQYDIVIIDTPPSINGLTRTAWVSSDRVLVVTEPSFFSVVASDRAMKAINEISRKINKRLKPLGVLVNRFQPQSQEHQFRLTELKQMFGSRLLPVHLEERAAMQQAQGAARPIHSWPGETAEALAGQFDEVLDLVMASFEGAAPRGLKAVEEFLGVDDGSATGARAGAATAAEQAGRRGGKKASKNAKKQAKEKAKEQAKAKKSAARSQKKQKGPHAGEDGSGVVSLESFENDFDSFLNPKD